MKAMLPFSSAGLVPAHFDRLFGDFVGRAASNLQAGPRVRLDLVETDDAYRVVAELPGVAREDLEITVADGVLTLAGEKKLAEEREGYAERVFGRFERKVRFRLPVDTERVSAEAKDGVVTIHLPKTEAVLARRIEVKG